MCIHVYMYRERERERERESAGRAGARGSANPACLLAALAADWLLGCFGLPWLALPSAIFCRPPGQTSRRPGSRPAADSPRRAPLNLSRPSDRDGTAQSGNGVSWWHGVRHGIALRVVGSTSALLRSLPSHVIPCCALQGRSTSDIAECLVLAGLRILASMM